MFRKVVIIIWTAINFLLSSCTYCRTALYSSNSLRILYCTRHHWNMFVTAKYIPFADPDQLIILQCLFQYLFQTQFYLVAIYKACYKRIRQTYTTRLISVMKGNINAGHVQKKKHCDGHVNTNKIIIIIIIIIIIVIIMGIIIIIIIIIMIMMMVIIIITIIMIIMIIIITITTITITITIVIIIL